MMKTLSVAAVALAAFSLAACGGAHQPPVDDDLAAITALNKRYLGAINDEDIATLSSLTTEAHVMIAPNRAPIVGKKANDELNGGAFERFTFDETWTPIETVVSGDLAFQRGTYTTAVTPKDGGDKREVSGTFLRIYQRQSNGEWRMTRDTFNSYE